MRSDLQGQPVEDKVSVDMSPTRATTRGEPSSPKPSVRTKAPFLEFFAGSGLVTHALSRHFEAVWANDISEKKAEVYRANHGHDRFHLGPIEEVAGESLPPAVLSWASFPCQDLSLAGDIAGIHGERSGLVWQWLRVMDETKKRIPTLAIENVAGLVSAHGGSHYRSLHDALAGRGYRVGAMLLDAARWIPQSRPRVFVVAVDGKVDVPERLVDSGPNWLHPRSIVRAAQGLDRWIWWRMPEPPARTLSLSDILEWDADVDDDRVAQHNLDLIPDSHRAKLNNGFLVAPGYKRTRQGKQVLELRFDDIAGCLRTPEGGSSRQFLVIKKSGKLLTRVLTARETARLMGAPDTYKLPGSYNDAYRAMGDAVAVPPARWLAKHLLFPLSEALNDDDR